MISPKNLPNETRFMHSFGIPTQAQPSQSGHPGIEPRASSLSFPLKQAERDVHGLFVGSCLEPHHDNPTLRPVSSDTCCGLPVQLRTPYIN